MRSFHMIKLGLITDYLSFGEGDGRVEDGPRDDLVAIWRRQGALVAVEAGRLVRQQVLQNDGLGQDTHGLPVR